MPAGGFISIFASFSTGCLACPALPSCVQPAESSLDLLSGYGFSYLSKKDCSIFEPAIVSFLSVNRDTHR
jgi:hypothetical protein